MTRIAALAVAGILSACASGAQVSQMVPAPGPVPVAEQSSPLYQAVAVGNVTGGQDTNPMWISKVGNADFSQALSQTLMAHSMLGRQDGGRYVLDVVLKDLDQPVFGLTFDVVSKVGYRLNDKKAGSVVMDEEVSATGSASVSDAFAGVERLRIANERSIKNNLQDFMKRLNQSKLAQVPTS